LEVTNQQLEVTNQQLEVTNQQLEAEKEAARQQSAEMEALLEQYRRRFGELPESKEL
jgi:hypothetical protein